MRPIKLAQKDAAVALTAVAGVGHQHGRRNPPCAHHARCPAATAADHAAARIIAFHPEQGWSLLCNGVILFDDDGELLPDGETGQPHLVGCGRPVAA